MNKEEIKHFKALLRQGILRHRNILLDDKFQEELLNIIKDYEKLQQENQVLKRNCNIGNENLSFYIQENNRLKEQRQELRNWLEEKIDEYGNSDAWLLEIGVIKNILSKLDELEGDNI